MEFPRVAPSLTRGDVVGLGRARAVDTLRVVSGSSSRLALPGSPAV